MSDSVSKQTRPDDASGVSQPEQNGTDAAAKGAESSPADSAPQTSSSAAASVDGVDPVAPADNQRQPEFVQQPRTGVGEFTKYTVSLLILLAGIGSVVGLQQFKDGTENVESKVLVPLVRTFAAEPYAGQLEMTVSGSAVAYREIDVAAEVGGTIVTKYPACHAGNFVLQGTKLLEIDKSDLLLQKRLVEKEIDQARKTIIETDEDINGARQSLELAEREYEVMQREFERNERLRGVLSDSELDAAERALLTAETQLTSRKSTLATLLARRNRLDATLELTQSRLDQINLDLERTTIVAPASGVIVVDTKEQGEAVNPNEVVLTLEDTTHSEVLCNFTNADLDWIRRNSRPEEPGFDNATKIVTWPAYFHAMWISIQINDMTKAVADSVYMLPKTPVVIYETGNPGVKWDGVLGFDGIGRDERTRTIPCRIVVNNPVVFDADGSHALVRGMFVECKIQVQTSAGEVDRQFLMFPEVALQPGDFVWIVRDKKLDRSDVRIVDRRTRMVTDEFGVEKEVDFVVVKLDDESNLGENDEIVVTPLSQPTVGADVIFEEDLQNLETDADEAG
ncbi:MAG: HlyD family efflux transporter periplasmic adaptor subunit [Planctomycetota bacterium]